jgi:hypothetical protein
VHEINGQKYVNHQTASRQVSVPLDRQFQRRLLEIDESETRIACGGHVLNESGRNKHYL